MDEVDAPVGEPHRRGLLVVVAAACVLLVIAAVLGYGRWRSSTVGDNDLVMVVRQAHVVDVLAPGITTAQINVTVENTTSTPVTVTEASFGGFVQTVSATVAAHGSTDLALGVQVVCSDRPVRLSMAATLTVAPPGGSAEVVTARVVEAGTADQLMAQCRRKVSA